MSVWALLVRFNLGDGESFQVPCTLKITGERKFVSILTERKTVTITDFFFIFPQKFELSGGILAQGTTKMVRLSECSSYRGFELSSDFYEKVLAKVQGDSKTVRVTGSSSYRGFELSGVYCIFIFLMVRAFIISQCLPTKIYAAQFINNDNLKWYIVYVRLWNCVLYIYIIIIIIII